MKRQCRINCTHRVRQLEDFFSSCSSGFFALGRLLASLLALFAWINLCLQHGVPMGANVSVGDLRLFGAGSLKSSASAWRGVVFVMLLIGMVAMGHVAWADENFSYEIKASGTKSPDVEFTVQLKAFGKEDVIRTETFSDDFPYLREDKAGLLKKKCTSAKRDVCLPSYCEIDYSKGSGKGYDILVKDEWQVTKRSHSFDEAKKCLISSIEVCTKPRKSGYKYDAEHVIYGKCKYTVDWDAITDSKKFTINAKDNFVNLANYDGQIGSSDPDRVPKSENQYDKYYEVIITDRTPSNTPLQVGMFKLNPENNTNGENFWARTNYSEPWNEVKQEEALIPETGLTTPEHIDSGSDISIPVNSNGDTTYSVSITRDDETYDQNQNGIVDAVDFMGWLSGENPDFFVTADMQLRPPFAVIDDILPNPALHGKDISFQGHGEYGTSQNPPITKATWKTNRFASPLYICSNNICSFVEDTLASGQHLISFVTEVFNYLLSPEATEILTVNIPPLAHITFIESTGEKDGVTKVVKWKDDEFDPLHDPIEFFGQMVDLDGYITKCVWKSDEDGELYKVENPNGIDNCSFSLPYSGKKLETFGIHYITLEVTDNDGETFTSAIKKVELMKPPVLLVHGLCGNSGSWNDADIFANNDYHVEKISIDPPNARFDYGATKVSEQIAEMVDSYGVPKVNIVAHSMGGINSRWYIQNYGYREDVNKLIMLGTPNHGSTLAAIIRAENSGKHSKIVKSSNILKLLYGASNLLAFFGVKDIKCMVGGSKGQQLWSVGWSAYSIASDSGFKKTDKGKKEKDKKEKDGKKSDKSSKDKSSTSSGTSISATSIPGFLNEMPDNAGYATIQLIPQSSALKSLNGNNKDEGCHSGNKCGENEPPDDISTVYGDKSRVQYFNIIGRGKPTISHKHNRKGKVKPVTPVIGFVGGFLKKTGIAGIGGAIVGELLQFGQWLSFKGDLVVHKKSAGLDGVPSEEVKIWHNNLRTKDKPLEKALYYLGDDPPILSDSSNEEEDISDTLAGHVLYVSEIENPPIISTGEEQLHQFEVDADANILHVLLMLPPEDELATLSLKLLSPLGEVIDPSTHLPENVAYDGEDTNLVSFHVLEAEAGIWTAIVKAEQANESNYAVIVTSETDFWVGVEEGTQIEPGKPFDITAYAQKDGTAMSGLEVKAVLLKTLDEGERIGSKYGNELRDADPEEISLTDIGEGLYQIVYDNTLAPGTYQVLITATDPTTGTSRVAFTTFFIEYQYELQVQSSDITFSNEAPEHGETITISANIHNDSQVDAKGVEVWFADDALNEGGEVFAKERIDIATDGSTEVSTSWTVSADTDEIFVIVSPMNNFIEENMENNVASKAIKVTDYPPVAYAGHDQIARFDINTQSNVHIFLDGSGSKDELEIEKYEWDIDTHFDSNGDSISDNDVDLVGIQPFIPAGTFSAIGQYEVKLTVFDKVGQSHSDTLNLQLTEEYDFEPAFADAGNDQNVALNTPVYFDSSNSRDNYGIATYLWDINVDTDSSGDGITDNDIDLMGMKPVLKHGYSNEGFYTIKLTVRDVAGNEPSTDTMLVAVGNVKTELYTLYGNIPNKSGAPIMGATIKVNGRQAVTNDEGNWKIEQLPEGKYPLTIHQEGYLFEPVEVEVGNQKYLNEVFTELQSALKVEITFRKQQVVKQDDNTIYFITRTHNSSSYIPEGTVLTHVAYTITVTNQGDKTATGVLVSDILPTNSDLTSIETLGSGVCRKNQVNCNLPDLASGETATVQVAVTTQETEVLENKVIVTTNEYPAGVATTLTYIRPDLSISIKDIPDPVEIESTLHYTYKVRLNESAYKDATGVTLVSQLPQGVELNSIQSDDGVCDTSALPQITCQLNDLSITSAESISQATVEMEVELKDAGLLLLTHEAQVIANEYPAHQTRERTTIFIPEEIQVDLAMVIDITGSMQEEMDSVIEALEEFLAKIDISQSPLMTLITFGDEVKVTAFTRNIEVLRGAIEDLTASGGGLCEEASVEALLVAIPHTKAEGEILFSTDASPYQDADVKKVVELLKDKKIIFDAIITGDCTMPESWNTLPQ